MYILCRYSTGAGLEIGSDPGSLPEPDGSLKGVTRTRPELTHGSGSDPGSLHHVMSHDFYTPYSHVITLHLLLYLLITLLINITLASFLLYMLLITLLILYLCYLSTNSMLLALTNSIYVKVCVDRELRLSTVLAKGMTFNKLNSSPPTMGEWLVYILSATKLASTLS
jgi:hypothetical protein